MLPLIEQKLKERVEGRAYMNMIIVFKGTERTKAMEGFSKTKENCN